MYNRLRPGRKDLTSEFTKGVEEFISFVERLADLSSGQIRCPCSRYKNKVYMKSEDVIIHLYKKGFVPDYWLWTNHGENNPTLREIPNRTGELGAESSAHPNRTEELIYEAFIGFEIEGHGDFEDKESPNVYAKNFYNLLHESKRPLWPGRENHTELSFAVRLMTNKSEENISQ
ncbi:hypothetical protein HN51_032054 [Arachis hypogaea]